MKDEIMVQTGIVGGWRWTAFFFGIILTLAVCFSGEAFRTLLSREYIRVRAGLYEAEDKMKNLEQERDKLLVACVNAGLIQGKITDSKGNVIAVSPGYKDDSTTETLEGRQ